MLDTTYSAANGIGAFKQEANKPAQKIQVSDYRNQKLKVVASRSHAGPDLQAFLDKLDDYDVISMGSSLKLCLVAEGAAHIYPRLGPTMEWDTAASHAVVNLAGGKVLNLEKEPLHYNKENLLNPYFVVVGNTPFNNSENLFL